MCDCNLPFWSVSSRTTARFCLSASRNWRSRLSSTACRSLRSACSSWHRCSHSALACASCLRNRCRSCSISYCSETTTKTMWTNWPAWVVVSRFVDVYVRYIIMIIIIICKWGLIRNEDILLLFLFIRICINHHISEINVERSQYDS